MRSTKRLGLRTEVPRGATCYDRAMMHPTSYRRLLTAAAAVALLAVDATILAAEESGPVPAFATLDRTALNPFVSGDTTIVVSVDRPAGQLDLAGQLQLTETLALYAAVRAGLAADVGAVYSRRFGAIALAARGSAARGSRFSEMFGAPTRPSDWILATPGRWLRVSGSLLGRSGNVFYRIDAGLDSGGWSLSASAPDGGAAAPRHLLLGRLNLGGGVYANSVALMAELCNLMVLDDQDPGRAPGRHESRSAHVAAATVRLDEVFLQPFISVVTPLKVASDYGLDVPNHLAVIAGIRWQPHR